MTKSPPLRRAVLTALSLSLFLIAGCADDDPAAPGVGRLAGTWVGSISYGDGTVPRASRIIVSGSEVRVIIEDSEVAIDLVRAEDPDLDFSYEFQFGTPPRTIKGHVHLYRYGENHLLGQALGVDEQRTDRWFLLGSLIFERSASASGFRMAMPSTWE